MTTTHPPRTPLSPRVAALEADPSTAAQAAFWQALVAGRGVLVEPGTSPRHRQVTFAWRPEPGEDVAVIVDTVTDRHRGDLSTCLLRRVPGTPFATVTLELPSDLRATYGFHVAHDLDVHVGATRDGWRRVLAGQQPGPLNLDHLGNSHGGTGSVLALPDAIPQPWTAPDPAAPRGELLAGEVTSRHLGLTAPTWVYRPHPSHGEPSAVAVLLDGDVWAEALPLTATLDNLHATGALPPTTVVLTACGPGESRGRELGLNPALPAYLRGELLPWAGALSPVTDDPARTVVCGQSLGGLAAAQVCLQAPERFGAAIVQSGSFWWPDDDPEVPSGALVRAYAAAPREVTRRLRVFHEVGSQEWQLLDCNREFRDAALAAGVEVHHREFGGGHDYACWRGGIADGLVTLLA